MPAPVIHATSRRHQHSPPASPAARDTEIVVLIVPHDEHDYLTQFLTKHVDWDDRGIASAKTRVHLANSSQKEADIRANVRRKEWTALGAAMDDSSTPMDVDIFLGQDGEEGGGENDRQAGQSDEWVESTEDGTFSEADLNKILGIRRPENRNFNYERTRVQLQNEYWKMLMPKLVEAILQYDMDGPPDEADAPGLHAPILVMDMEGREERSFPLIQDIGFTETLARYGYIATAPNHPSLAFSIRAFVRALCDLHKEPYKRSMRGAFSSAYDVYIEIIHTVDSRLNGFLCETIISKYQDACPACVYRVDGEPHLKYSMLTCMDGNESMKRVRRTRTVDEDVNICVERPDGRGRGSHMFLEAEEVEIFKDEVEQARALRAQERRGTCSMASDLQSSSHVDESTTATAPTSSQLTTSLTSTPTATPSSTAQTAASTGVSVPGANEASPCVPRWKNMSDDSKKKMWGIFDETGIFITTCRHGVVLLICDMIQSGELWKYPLAMVNRLVDVFGKDIMNASDVGCEFSATANSTPLVGPKLRWHPLYTKGVGLEDFETCERVFSESNRVATCTRHASKFHRRQALLLHFARWNADKKAEISRFILNNYRQALRNIDTLSSELAGAQSCLGIENSAIFKQWHAEEYAYLQSLSKPQEFDVLAMQYVKTLKRLSAAVLSYENTKHMWMRTSNEIIRNTYNYSQESSATKSIERARSQGLETVLTFQKEAEDYEAKLGVQLRWTEDCEEWKAADITLAEHDYRRAVDHLEGLVIARLFELSKMGRAGTCCNLRTQLSKRMKARSGAIRNAVGKYNRAAAALRPPRKPLEMKVVLDYIFIAEFDLLRDSRHDLQEKPWARSAEREAATVYYKLERSREEILRLNVEITRLMAYIGDKEKRLANAATMLEVTDPALAHQLKKRQKIEMALNKVHRQRIYDIATLDGFLGDVHAATVFCCAEGGVAQEEGELEDTGGDGDNLDDNVEAAFQVLSLGD
ncbi:hypothetical protein DFH11DRAFT_1549792 [Phellopilus nigrolimitatus]|nr:hypothetical protein DFH11DRAFT_1549792 [Phellopilus nigrolimitatus]